MAIHHAELSLCKDRRQRRRLNATPQNTHVAAGLNTEDRITIEVIMQSFKITVDTTPEAAEKAVREALSVEGFGVITEIDMAATFKAKLDFDRPPLKILGACNPDFARAALEFDPSIAFLLPCNVVIEQTSEGVTVSTADPRDLINDPALDELVTDVANRVERALNSVKAHFASTTSKNNG